LDGRSQKEVDQTPRVWVVIKVEGDRRPAKGKNMATSQMNEVIQHLRKAVLLRNSAGLTDGQLLEDYLSRKEEAALAALVRRHAPMVWGVCRRVLDSHHDAEDAFQATFLVLVRKAPSIACRELLANWLYGVAHQTALKARGTIAKRKIRERQVTEMPEPASVEKDFRDDLQPLLDQELSRLPDSYRAVIVLCDLEGKTRKEVACQLGLPEGTVGSRLARARVMLAKRLSQHGLAVSGGALGTMLAQNVASAGVPALVVSNTVKAASFFAAGQTAGAGLVSAKAAALTEGVLQTMLLSKIKVATAVLVVAVAVGVSGNRLLVSSRAAEGVDEPKQVQSRQPQPLPRKDQPRIDVIKVRDGEAVGHVLFVRDPSSGKFKPLTREDGIPVVKGYIEFHVKKLKEAKDDKSIREALKGLEESVQNMKDLLGFPDAPAEKKLGAPAQRKSWKQPLSSGVPAQKSWKQLLSSGVPAQKSWKQLLSSGVPAQKSWKQLLSSGVPAQTELWKELMSLEPREQLHRTQLV
jgi:RNA polymerase sigma factor (sigma-70 family)